MTTNCHSQSAVDILSNKLNKKADMMTHDDEVEIDYNTGDEYESESEGMQLKTVDQSLPIIHKTHPDKEWIVEHLFYYFSVIMEYLFYKMNAPYVCPFVDKRIKVPCETVRDEYIENNMVLSNLNKNDVGAYMDSLKSLITDTIFYIEDNNIKKLAITIANTGKGVIMGHTKPDCPDTIHDYITLDDQDIFSMISGRLLGQRLDNVKKTDIIHVYDIQTGDYLGSVGNDNERQIVDYLNRFIHIRHIIEVISRDFMLKMDVSTKQNIKDKNLKRYLKYQPESKYALNYGVFIELRDNYDELQYLEGMFKCMIITRCRSLSDNGFDIISTMSEMFLRIYELVMMKLSPSGNINYSLFKSKLKHLNLKSSDEIDSSDEEERKNKEEEKREKLREKIEEYKKRDREEKEEKIFRLCRLENKRDMCD